MKTFTREMRPIGSAYYFRYWLTGERKAREIDIAAIYSGSIQARPQEDCNMVTARNTIFAEGARRIELFSPAGVEVYLKNPKAEGGWERTFHHYGEAE